MIHVCSLARLHETVEETKASHIVTLLKDRHLVSRPNGIAADRHLILGLDDICEPADGFVCPAEEHVTDLIDFVRGWNRGAPMVVHCYAGISRSTASAFAAACLLNPHRDEISIARQIRAASPIASPNRLIVSLADKAMGREGRMLRALDEMGPGSMTVEGRPFRIDLD
ncbi:MAG: tyrosine phosphatase family protein [Xanthobacteraceae bacterium]